MIYGNQWDQVMSWLKETKFVNEPGKVDEDSTSWGNYRDNNVSGVGTPQKSGYSEIWKANNIYDLARNYAEWTQEARGIGLNSTRIAKGGIYDAVGTWSSKMAVADRYNDNILNINYATTRVALYIK